MHCSGFIDPMDPYTKILISPYFSDNRIVKAQNYECTVTSSTSAIRRVLSESVYVIDDKSVMF